MTYRISRADLFRGRVGSRPAPLRPPWALPEAFFVDACDRSGACLDACEESVIREGSGGFPEIDYSTGECTFCRACVEACQSGAIGPLIGGDGARRRPWTVAVRISDACVSAKGVVCRVCRERCDTGAIRFATPAAIGLPFVDERKCSGCGACVAPCPTQAISLQPAG